MDAAVQGFEAALDQISALDEFREGFFFVAPEEGRAAAPTLRRSRHALEASRPAASNLRTKAALAADGGVISATQYQLGVHLDRQEARNRSSPDDRQSAALLRTIAIVAVVVVLDPTVRWARATSCSSQSAGHHAGIVEIARSDHSRAVRLRAVPTLDTLLLRRIPPSSTGANTVLTKSRNLLPEAVVDRDTYRLRRQGDSPPHCRDRARPPPLQRGVHRRLPPA